LKAPPLATSPDAAEKAGSPLDLGKKKLPKEV